MQVADRAIEVLEGVASDPDSERVKTHGQKTTKFLFHLGADHLKKSVIIIIIIIIMIIFIIVSPSLSLSPSVLTYQVLLQLPSVSFCFQRVMSGSQLLP